MTESMKENVLSEIEDKYLAEVLDYTKARKEKRSGKLIALGRIAACFAVIIGLSISSISIAVAAGNMAAYDILYAVYPEIAVKLMPVNVVCEDNGVRMEVEGVTVTDNCAQVYISMTDLEGGYIDETIDLFDSYSIHTNADQIGGCTFIDFDEADRKATFLITVQNMDATPMDGSVMTFSVSKFLSGKCEIQGELPQISQDSVSEAEETQRAEGLKIRGGSYEEGEEYLCADESKAFVPTPGATVTNYGFVDDKLHVQVYYEDILQFDNHGFVYLVDAQGKEVYPVSNTAFWDEENRGSYEEYIFDISEDEFAGYAVYGQFVTCQNFVEGDWEVKFSIENRE